MTFVELMKQHLRNIKVRADAARRAAQDYDVKAGIIEQEMREFEHLLDRWEQETRDAAPKAVCADPPTKRGEEPRSGDSPVGWGNEKEFPTDLD